MSPAPGTRQSGFGMLGSYQRRNAKHLKIDRWKK